MSLKFNSAQVARITAQQPFPMSGAINPSFYPPSSRYHDLQVLQYEQADGRTAAYLERRFLPDPRSFAVLSEHTVSLGDRLDNLAHQYFGDAERYWLIADANAALQPEELTSEIGRKLRITLPEGIPEVRRA